MGLAGGHAGDHHHHHHDHHHHAHGAAVDGDARRRALGLAFWLTLVVLAAELAGAYASGSLALGADAGHVLSDVLALGLSAWAARLSMRPPSGAWTYGLGRSGVLVAAVNAALLVLIAVGIFAAAVGRLTHPVAVRAGLMWIPAAFGLAVNLFIAARLHGHAHADLNTRSAWLHVVGDAGAAGAVVVAAPVILLTGWTWVDPVLSLGIALFIAYGALQVLRRSGNVLLEGVPEGLDTAGVAEAMSAVPGVQGVHHVHLWSIGGGRRALSGHLVLGSITLAEGQRIAREVEHTLAHRFGIDHCTLQIEAAGDCGECQPQ